MLPPTRIGRQAGMTDPEQQIWWRTTRALAVATLGGALLLGFLLFVAARAAGEETVFALPVDYLLAAFVMPLILLAAIFWSARRQIEVDREHHMSED
jgi:hypothetical protein